MPSATAILNRRKWGTSTAPRCSVQGCNSPAAQVHHVTYDPEVTFPLCELHHQHITAIHAHQGRRQRHALSNKQRWAIWYKFVRGELKKPRITHLDREWSESG